MSGLAFDADPMPPGQIHCSICGLPHDNPSLAANCKTMVGRNCDDRAVNSDGVMPKHDSIWNSGDSPVFIDSLKCSMWYEFGGYSTMRDLWVSSSVSPFYRTMLNRN